jgi:hypothetical protein
VCLPVLIVRLAAVRRRKGCSRTKARTRPPCALQPFPPSPPSPAPLCPTLLLSRPPPLAAWLTASSATLMETRVFWVPTHTDSASCCSSSPKGLRLYEGQNWASLRLATFSSFTALSYASLPGVTLVEATAARCLARSQLGYVAGDTGRSYIVGFGTNFPQQVHHRDAACTLAEDAAGFCERSAALRLPCVAAIDQDVLFVYPGRSGLLPCSHILPNSSASLHCTA